MTKVTVNLENKKHTQKPSAVDIKSLQNIIYKSETQLPIDQYAYEIAVNGKSSMLATFERTENYKERTSNINFKQQQVVMLDFDNSPEDIEKYGEFTFTEALKDPFIRNNASFLYKTFSDKDSEVDKFRVVFLLSKKVKDYLDIQNIYIKLLSMFRQADTKCKNTNRLFFGSNAGYQEINFENTLDVDTFLSDVVVLNKKEPKVQKTIVKNNKKIKVISQTSSVSEGLKVWELIKENTPASLSQAKEITLSKFDKTISKVFASTAQARLAFRHTIDIKAFLDLPAESPFLDILHEETNPSASVYTHNNVQLYKLFNKSKSSNYDIIRLIANLIAKDNHVDTRKALDILLYLTNSQVDNDSKVARQKEDIDYIVSVLRSETFNVEYKNTSKILGNDVLATAQILELMNEHSYEDFETGEIRQLLFMNSETLARQLNHRLSRSYTKERVQRILNKSTLIHFIDKLGVDDIPSELYNKYTAMQKRENKMEINFYEASQKSLEFKETFATDLVSKKYTLSALNYEGLSRILSLEDAQRVFNNRAETVKRNKIAVDIDNPDLLSTTKSEQEQVISKFALKEITKKGYVTEKEIVEYLKRYHKKLVSGNAQNVVKQLRTGVCDNYALEMLSLNKDVRNTYKIPAKVASRSTIFVQK